MAYTWYHLHPGFGWELLYSLQEPACRDSCFELRLWVLFSIVRVIDSKTIRSTKGAYPLLGRGQLSGSVEPPEKRLPWMT